jgi:hypothetical protein
VEEGVTVGVDDEARDADENCGPLICTVWSVGRGGKFKRLGGRMF